MHFSPGPGATVPLLTVLLVLPVALTFHLRRNALSASVADRTVVWFAFVRSLRWTLIGAMVLWWAATDFVGLRGYTFAAADALGWGDSAAGYVLSIFLAWLPIFLVVVLCTVISQPVYAGIRGLTWTRGELAKLAVLRMGTTYVPLLLIIASFKALGDSGSLPDYFYCFGGATTIYLVSARFLRTTMQWKPEALTSGELRDRAFALAKKLGAKLNQIYVVPAGKMQMANAFASSANAVLLTEHLLARLNKREVDAVLAHELAHIKHNHARTRGMIAGAAGAGIGFWYAAAGDSPYLPLLDIAFCCALLFGLYFLSRKFEFTADAEGARLTGDAESMISGLARLHALNVFPVRWGSGTEKTMTHPSVTRRAEAIAKAAGFPIERVSMVLESALAVPPAPELSPSERYILPEGVQGGAKVFSTELKRRMHWQSYLTSLAVMTAVPAAIVRAIDIWGWPQRGWMISGTAFLFTALVWLACSNYAPVAGLNRVGKHLRRKLEQEGAHPGAWDGVFVGFSPEATVRVYDSGSAWDVGYFFIAGDRLCYWGEATRFTLRRDQIVSAQLGPGMPGVLKVPSIYITWSNAATGRNETFRIGRSDRRSLLSMAEATRALEKRIAAWLANEPSASRNELNSLPEPLAELGPPSVGAVTGTSLRQYARPGQVIRSVVIVGFLAGCATALFGIPVDVTSLIAHVFHLVGPDEADFRGWYAVLASLLAVLLSFAPFWFHRDLASGTATRMNPVRPIPESK
jgi:Zn-dependent protease with chaperone function